MDLHAIAQQLKRDELTVSLALEFLRGRYEITAWFACDAVEWAFFRAAADRGELLKERCLRALSVTRRYLSGEAHQEELTLAVFAAWSNLQADPHPVWEALWNVTLSPFSQEAALNVVQMQWGPDPFGLPEPSPQTWKRLRLAYLLDVWLACGARSTWLLLDHLCPIPAPEWAALPSSP